MNIDWSFHAQDQFAGILRTIAFKLSYDDAVRWRLKINGDLAPLADFPESCPNIPPECFYEVPRLVDACAWDELQEKLEKMEAYEDHRVAI